ncbi:acyl-CoA dehydratase activase [Chloroflexota bacterium]
MVVAGIDIGSATSKAVILDEKEILSFFVMPTGHNVVKAVDAVTKEALDESGLSIDQVQYIVSTGYGRRAVQFANKVVTEIICHAAGVSSMIPQARTVIDVGGQDSKVIGLDDDGNVLTFVMNDKCAAGTGRFLEVLAKILEVDMDGMGPISLLGADPCQISNTCTVFAETEMVSLRAEGQKRENIIAGIHKAMARRIAIMGKSVSFKKDVVFTGGVARNVGMKKALEEEINLEILIPEEPQIMGALGAAILAKSEYKKLNKT